jgi:peptidyl-prolyl cis-trans isomerase A (cyclophilin A)
VAFYALDSSRNLGTQIYRFQNTNVPGTYLFAGPAEAENILANFPNFSLEGEAFEVVG